MDKFPEDHLGTAPIPGWEKQYAQTIRQWKTRRVSRLEALWEAQPLETDLFVRPIRDVLGVEREKGPSGPHQQPSRALLQQQG